LSTIHFHVRNLSLYLSLRTAVRACDDSITKGAKGDYIYSLYRKLAMTIRSDRPDLQNSILVKTFSYSPGSRDTGV